MRLSESYAEQAAATDGRLTLQGFFVGNELADLIAMHAGERDLDVDTTVMALG